MLTNLKILYMHGNLIDNIREIRKLATLSKLAKFSTHGNPIELQTVRNFNRSLFNRTFNQALVKYHILFLGLLPERLVVFPKTYPTRLHWSVIQ